MKKYNCGIYKIENKINGKMYIGSSSKLNNRISEHFRLLNTNRHRNKYLQNSYIKYGRENFKFQILLYCDKKNLIYYEQCFMDSCDFNMLYNIRKKADSNIGIKLSIETRKKLSIVRSGRKLKEETKKRISEAHKGKKLSEKTKRKLSVLNTGKNHPKYGTTHSEDTKKKIGDSHRGEKCYLYGKKYHDNPFSIPVVQICKHTNRIIKIWSSATEASHKLNLNRSHIAAVCRNRRNQTGGFKWKYLNPPPGL